MQKNSLFQINSELVDVTNLLLENGATIVENLNLNFK